MGVYEQKSTEIRDLPLRTQFHTHSFKEMAENLLKVSLKDLKDKPFSQRSYDEWKNIKENRQSPNLDITSEKKDRDKVYLRKVLKYHELIIQVMSMSISSLQLKWMFVSLMGIFWKVKLFWMFSLKILRLKALWIYWYAYWRISENTYHFTGFAVQGGGVVYWRLP